MRRTVEAFKRYLEILMAIDGRSSVSELIKRLGYRPATFLTYLEDLVELGLVEIRVEPGAPPRRIPVLTEKGRCLVQCFKS